MEELDKLYNVITREGLFTQSLDKFKNNLNSDPDYKRKVYDIVVSKGLFTQNYETFNNTYYKGLSPETKVEVKEEDNFNWFLNNEKKPKIKETPEVEDVEVEEKVETPTTTGDPLAITGIDRAYAGSAAPGYIDPKATSDKSKLKTWQTADEIKAINEEIDRLREEFNKAKDSDDPYAEEMLYEKYGVNDQLNELLADKNRRYEDQVLYVDASKPFEYQPFVSRTNTLGVEAAGENYYYTDKKGKNYKVIATDNKDLVNFTAPEGSPIIGVAGLMATEEQVLLREQSQRQQDEEKAKAETAAN